MILVRRPSSSMTRYFLFPKSRVAWEWIKGLPTPPQELAAYR